MNKLFTVFLGIILSMLFFSTLAQAQTRIVCVGNSVTAGYNLTSPAIESWPAQLGAMLGDNYTVFNCGVSGTTMLKNGIAPYWNTSRFNDAKNFNPDILIIALGTNDAHPDNWQSNEFYNDYVDMIDEFRQNGRNPKIYVCCPVTCYGDGNQIYNLQNELIPLVYQIRDTKGTAIIDFNTPTQNQRNTLYNDDLHPNVQGASIIARAAYNAITPSVPAFYSDCDFNGTGIKLGVGDYTFNAISANGIYNDDISSIQVPIGYKVYAYVADNFSGNYLTLTEDNSCLGGWDNLFTSIKVVANGVPNMNGIYTLQNRGSEKFIDVSGGNPADGTNILQWDGNGQTNQQFSFTDQGNGVYSIINEATNKAIDIAGASSDNLANVLQWTNNDADNQKFILIDAEDDFFKLKALHSGRIIEVSGGGTNTGANIIQYDDNNQIHGQWRLIASNTSNLLTSKEASETTIVSRKESGDQEIRLYPNPATNTIMLTKTPKDSKISITDFNGEEVLGCEQSRIGEGTRVNVSSLETGIYFFRIAERPDITLKLIKK